MARVSNTLRGARIAFWQASEILRAHFDFDALFRLDLSDDELEFWLAICDAAQFEMLEQEACHVILRGNSA